jgi:hypothetical protein
LVRGTIFLPFNQSVGCEWQHFNKSINQTVGYEEHYFNHGIQTIC